MKLDRKKIITAIAVLVGAIILGTLLGMGGAKAQTYPFGMSEKRDCVIWAVVPFPCHAGFDYEEPGMTEDGKPSVVVLPDDEAEEEGEQEEE